VDISLLERINSAFNTMNGVGINLPGVALVVIAVVTVIALFHGWG
jgi:hypothetical protein